MKYSWYFLLLIIISISSSAFAADYEVQTFKRGQWFVYEGDVKIVLLVSSLSEPQCYQIADILILLNNREQALDVELLQNAARKGLSDYHAYCSAINQQGSKVRSVVAFVADSALPDDYGRVIGNDVLVSGRITTSGNPIDGILEIRTNKVAMVQNKNGGGTNAIVNIQNKIEEERKLEIANKQTEIDNIRERFKLHFEQSNASYKPLGFFDGMISGDSEKLYGTWASSTAQCSQDVLILFDNDGVDKVEWWRNFKSYGLLPWRSGSWELRSDILAMRFNHRTEFTFIKGFEDTLMNENVQLKLRAISSDELLLASPEQNSKAQKLLKTDEKLFIRCPSQT